MSDYVKITDYAAKDALLSGNPAKIVKGTEIGADFDAVAVAVATKVDETGGAATNLTLTTPALGTPTSGTLTNCTGLPVSTGVSGLGANVATFLATPSSANLASAVTDETGTGALVFANTPTLVTPILGTPTSGTLTNCTGLPAAGVSGTALVSADIGVSVQAYDADIPTVSASQAEMEAGTEAALRSMSPLRVAQAIAALGGGGGKVVQHVYTQTGAVATGTTTVPLDDTIPQNTEGTEFMTLSVTPTNAANKLEIDVLWNGAATNGGHLTVALFQDSTADAIASVIEAVGANDQVPMSLRHTMVAGTTSSTTFKVRVGLNNSSTTTFNGRSSARTDGGVLASSISIKEISV